VINIRLRANIFANYPDAMSLTDLAGALGISTKRARIIPKTVSSLSIYAY
jgi:hypothetical protein